jgi:hypothetical protein
MNPIRTGTCEWCETSAPLTSRYVRYDPATGVGHDFDFCSDACRKAWLRERDGLPNHGIVHKPGPEAAE